MNRTIQQRDAFRKPDVQFSDVYCIHCIILFKNVVNSSFSDPNPNLAELWLHVKVLQEQQLILSDVSRRLLKLQQHKPGNSSGTGQLIARQFIPGLFITTTCSYPFLALPILGNSTEQGSAMNCPSTSFETKHAGFDYINV